MRKFSTIERIGLGLGIAFVLAGTWLAVFPQDYITRIQANERVGNKAFVQKIDKKGCRLDGLLTCFVGLGIAAVSVYPFRRK